MTAAALFALGMAALLLETGLTRILSFVLAYNQAGLLLMASLLGGVLGARLAAGSVRARAGTWQAGIGLTGAAALVLGLLCLARPGLETAQLLRATGPALGLAARLAPFALAWAALAAIGAVRLGEGSARVGCAAFCLGLAAGAWSSAPLLGRLGAPACVVLAAALLALAGGAAATQRVSPAGGPTAARRLPPATAVAGCAALALALLASRPELIPDPAPDASVEHLGSTHTALFSRWGPASRVDVFEHGPDLRMLYVDGLWSGNIQRFGGDSAAVSGLAADPRALAYRLAPQPPGRVAVLGVGGGRDVLEALAQGAAQVLAVEEDPLVASLLGEVFADYSGHLLRHERVTFLRESVRAFLARDPGSFDVVQLAAPLSFAAPSAALASALVLPESRQLGVEALARMLGSLSDQGVLSLSVGELSWEEPPLTLRVLATLREAYRRLGVRDPGPYLVVLSSEGFGQLVTLLLCRNPIDEAGLQRLLAGVSGRAGVALQFAAGRVFGRGPAVDLLLQPDRALDGWLARQPWNLRPISDDVPFPWRWQRLRAPWIEHGLGLPGDVHDGRRERLLLWLLAASLALSGWLALAPPSGLRRPPLASRLALPLLGAGAACCQAGLAQVLAPALGDPLRTLGVLLPALYAWAALGSLALARPAAAPALRLGVALLAPAGAAAACFGVAAHADAILAAPAALAAAIAVASAAPIGLALGAAFPAALSRMAGAGGEGCWASSCLASGFVAGALLAPLVAMLWGFSALLGGASLTLVLVAAPSIHGARQP